ncbi:MAG: ABC-F family ATP-binding cassette domain-containing protein [Lentisphaeria bacterium]|nr:ABC-F family ATP-binding cassette domain-containing protein [Lentisphaeria bacterium]
MNEQPLWSGEKLNLAVGSQILLKDADLCIGTGERVALIGRNGCGKSTFLRIVAGTEKPASGTVSVARNCRIACMPQDPGDTAGKTVGSTVKEGLAFFEDLLARYDRLSPASSEAVRLEHMLTLHQAWNTGNKLETMLDKLALDPERPLAELSGGEMRRVLLARTLAAEPDLLLLDEPTNHLDVDTVSWMENILSSCRGACLFVTHDRFFLDRVATRIVELSNGAFFSCAGSYADFLEAKEAHIRAEDAETERREKFLRLEIDWVRRSPKARLRRNLGRLRRFEELSAVESPRREGDVELILPAPPRLGNKVVELKNVSFSIGGRQLIKDFSCEFPAGSKTGVVGPNGIGKTTLLKLITGSLVPDAGTISVADTVRFNYADQSRIVLDPEKTAAEAVAGDCGSVQIDGAWISVRSYLKRLLFDDGRINSKVKYLSGGEKARLLLAAVLKQGGNFLILDEPTNDLDIPTLRVLEESLRRWSAPVIVVSHDRYFLDRVCDRILSFDPREGIALWNGDYDYFASKQTERRAAAAPEKKPSAPPPVRGRPGKPAGKLSYREQRELEGMEDAVLRAEEAVSALEKEFTAPDFYTTRAKDAPLMQAKLASARAELDRLYARWEELEKKKE